MKTYDISYLENSQWKPAEQVTAVSRRQLMKRLRENKAYLHTPFIASYNDAGQPIIANGGRYHGTCKVSLAT